MSPKAFGEFSPHLIRSSGGPTINGSTQYRARFFCAKYETFDCVFHSFYLFGIRAEDELKLSDDVIEDNFTSALDSRIWDLSPMRLGAAKTARESAKSPAEPATICRALFYARVATFHHRADGTYVVPQYQTNPSPNPYDNWSTKGNYNP